MSRTTLFELIPICRRRCAFERAIRGNDLADVEFEARAQMATGNRRHPGRVARGVHAAGSASCVIRALRTGARYEVRKDRATIQSNGYSGTVGH